MASGCILNDDCPVCHELVWEDDCTMFHDLLMHTGCTKQNTKSRYGMSEKQYIGLCGAQLLRKDIEFLKEIESERHNETIEMLKEMEQRLKIIENK